MGGQKREIPIIRTKLHRTPVASDLISRKALYDRLDEGSHQPLTLVSAPAGYGKSTLVSHWLETREGPSAWLSLDETDSDVRMFLSYVVAALQTVFPEAWAETLAQLEAEVLAPLPVLAGRLINALDDLDESLVLVLDDYHRIHEPPVHELLDHLLKHPPGALQLVVISRRDPPLSLGALRAHNSMTEIRMQDLKFTLAETATFLEQATGQTVSSTALARLHQSTEGWVTGLRLAALALKHRSDADAFLRGFSGEASAVRDYLIEEVLALQLPAARDCLRQTSILNRFCAPLCSAVCIGECNAGEQPPWGINFIRFLEKEGMLCVALDEQGEWYRYHHLFQELLQRQLKACLAPDEIAGLHRRAASWFEAQGLLEEAIHHLLQADEPAEAGRLIVRHRNEILNGEQWHRLDQWLKQLPAEVTEDNPELLMLKAWTCQNRGRYTQAYALLDCIDELLADGKCEWCDTERLRGSINALRGRQRYDEGHGELAMQHIELALEQLPHDCLAERGYTLIHVGAALQMCGELEQARERVFAQLADTSIPTGTFQGRLLIILSFMNWIAGDLEALQLTAPQIFALGEEHGLVESILFGRYFSGIAEYQRNELAKAEASLTPVVADLKVPNLEFLVESALALAAVYQATGRADMAREAVDSVCERILHARNPILLHRAQAYQADLALRQGRVSEAARWAEGFNPEPIRAMYQFYEPRIALARVLIAQVSVDSRMQADRLLTRLETFVAGIHATRFLIEVLALRALLHDAQGDEPAAREALGRALSLAQPGGFIRLFADLGPGFARLFNGLDMDAEGRRYVGQILAACQGDEQTKADAALAPPLTKREREILKLLSNELSNRQIADQLSISPSTVKRHTENIYHKLSVPDRRKAVAKAVGLDII